MSSSWSLCFLLVACSGGSINQGGDIPDDTADPTDGGGTDGTDDGGTDDGGSDDGGTDDGGTADGSDDGGTDDGGDDGTTDGPCSNDYDPVHLDGWSKTYVATYNGETGTATMEGHPPLNEGINDATYQYGETLEAGTDGWTGTVTVNCQSGTDSEGLHLVGWDMAVNYSGIPMTVQGTESEPRMYLPADWMIGGVGSWDYAYTLFAVTDAKKGSSIDFTVTGTYVESGFETIELFDGSMVEAYKLTNTYAMTSMILNMNGVIEQWWVKGLGLVKEINTDSSTAGILMTKDLSGYTALSVVE